MRAGLLLTSLATLLPAIYAAPADKLPSPPLVTSTSQVAAPEPPVVQINPIPTSSLPKAASTPAPVMVFAEPPPIFDPPEPRPETLFDSPSTKQENVLKPPPIPLNRMERMSAFDGARAHPDLTPYLPDAADMTSCSFAVELLKLCGSIIGLLFVGFVIISTTEKVFRGCFRAIRGRRRTVGEEGRILLDETNIEKGEGNSLAHALARSRSASKVLPV